MQPVLVASTPAKERVILYNERERFLSYCLNNGIVKKPDTLRILRQVPREEFFPEHQRMSAWKNEALPIKVGFCHISTPETCALMLDRALPLPGQIVLDVGTCSGYTAALYKESVGPSGKVFSIEIDHDMAVQARENHRKLGYDIEVIEGDGWKGLASEAPFDKIMVSASTPWPHLLLEQLREFGHMVLPLRMGFSDQLTSIWRMSNDMIIEKIQDLMVFVPLHDDSIKAV